MTKKSTVKHWFHDWNDSIRIFGWKRTIQTLKESETVMSNDRLGLIPTPLITLLNHSTTIFYNGINCVLKDHNHVTYLIQITEL